MLTKQSRNSVQRFHVHVLVLVLSLSLAGQSPGSQTSRQTQVQPGGPFGKALTDLEMVNVDALRRAVRDLAKSFPAEYGNGEDFLRTIDSIESNLPKTKEALLRRYTDALRAAEEIIAFRREALLSNPLLNFDRLLLIRRKPLGDPRRSHEPDRGIGKFVGMPQQSSWQLHTMRNTDGWDNEICVLSRPNGRRKSKPKFPVFRAGRLMPPRPNAAKKKPDRPIGLSSSVGVSSLSWSVFRPVISSWGTRLATTMSGPLRV